MELRHLRYFVAVAEEGHVHNAAARLGIAQPALTQQMKALERETCVRLLVRAGRGIALSEAGRAFHVEAKSILAHVERAVEAARQIETGQAGLLRVGFTESASFHPAVTGALKRFRLAWPGVECRLEEKQTEALVGSLEDGSLDAAFVRPPLRLSEAVGFEPLASEPLVVALPSDHALGGRASLTVAELAGEVFVTYPRRTGAGLSDAVLAECRRAGYAPRVVQRSPQLSSTINLVAAGMGIAVVPECMRLQRSESVRFVPLGTVDLRAELGFAWRRSASRALLNLVDIVRRPSPAPVMTPPPPNMRGWMDR